MMRYIALFRGINVGGKAVVKMADLKKLLTGLGYRDVQSYIQSGNVVFDAEATQGKLTNEIQEGFAHALGFNSMVTLRTEAEWSALVAGLPFSQEEMDAATAVNPDVEHVYVYLAEETLDAAAVEALIAGYSGGDRLRFGKREIYLLCRGSIRDSKPAAALSKLHVPLTARNWKTIMRLQEMLVG